MAFTRWGGLPAPGLLGWLAELGAEDIQHKQGDDDADSRVDGLLQMLDFFVAFFLFLLQPQFTDFQASHDHRSRYSPAIRQRVIVFTNF